MYLTHVFAYCCLNITQRKDFLTTLPFDSTHSKSSEKKKWLEYSGPSIGVAEPWPLQAFGE